MSESTSVCFNCPPLCRARCARLSPVTSHLRPVSSVIFAHRLPSLSQCSVFDASLLIPATYRLRMNVSSLFFSVFFCTSGRREILCPHSASSSARPSAWHTSVWHRWRCRLIHWGESLPSDKLLEALQSLQNVLTRVCSGDSTKIDKWKKPQW